MKKSRILFSALLLSSNLTFASDGQPNDPYSAAHPFSNNPTPFTKNVLVASAVVGSILLAVWYWRSGQPNNSDEASDSSAKSSNDFSEQTQTPDRNPIFAPQVPETPQFPRTNDEGNFPPQEEGEVQTPSDFEPSNNDGTDTPEGNLYDIHSNSSDLNQNENTGHPDLSSQIVPLASLSQQIIPLTVSLAKGEKEITEEEITEEERTEEGRTEEGRTEEEITEEEITNPLPLFKEQSVDQQNLPETPAQQVQLEKDKIWVQQNRDTPIGIWTWDEEMNIPIFEFKQGNIRNRNNAEVLLSYINSQKEAPKKFALKIPEGGIAISENFFNPEKRFCFDFLAKVILPSSLKIIGEKTFRDCVNLEEVVLNEGLEQIQREAFLGCTNLKKITIPSSVTIMDNHVFEDCTNLEEIVFSGDKKRDLTFASNVFVNSPALRIVRLPDIKPQLWCNNADDVFKGISPSCRVLVSPDPETMQINDDLRIFLTENGFIQEWWKGSEAEKEEGCFVFKKANLITKVTIPEGVTEIKDKSFYGCSNLQSIVIPESVTKIGDLAFAGCERLAAITVPAFSDIINDDGSESIGALPLENFKGLFSSGYVCQMFLKDCRADPY